MAYGPIAWMDVKAERGGCTLSESCSGQYRRMGQGLQERVGFENGRMEAQSVVCENRCRRYCRICVILYMHSSCCCRTTTCPEYYNMARVDLHRVA